MKRSSPLAEIASVSHRLSVLLAAGVSPAAAWAFIAESAQSGVPSAVAGEPDVPEALALAAACLPESPRRAWLGLAAAWSVATDAGAPLAGTLRDYATSLRSLADADRDAEIALAAPRATARIVMALPLIGVIFGALLGFGTFSVLFTTVPGWCCLALGAVLMLVARVWSARLLIAAKPSNITPGLDHELAAIAVSGGASLDRAQASAQRAARRFEVISAFDQTNSVFELSRRAGVPAAELLRAEAEESRRDARAHAQRRASALGVQLMLPLGVCILPAFLAVGVVPLFIAVLSSTVGGF